MSPKTGKRVLMPGTSSVFVGGRGGATAPVLWRLDVRDDAGGKSHLFHKRRRPGVDRNRHKLFHYISAGGLRQLRRTTFDDIVENRRRSFLLFLWMVVVVWIVFYFLPSS